MILNSLENRPDTKLVSLIFPREKNSIVGSDDIDWRFYKYRRLVKNTFSKSSTLEPLPSVMINLKQRCFVDYPSFSIYIVAICEARFNECITSFDLY